MRLKRSVSRAIYEAWGMEEGVMKMWYVEILLHSCHSSQLVL
jgi:hypothetical protein